MSDPLCVCGHRASNHATPDSGDTRCLAVEAREDLLSVFDDGRDGGLRLLRLPALHPRPTDPATGGLMPLRATRTLGTGDGWDITDSGIYVPDWADLNDVRPGSIIENPDRQPIRRRGLSSAASGSTWAASTACAASRTPPRSAATRSTAPNRVRYRDTSLLDGLNACAAGTQLRLEQPPTAAARSASEVGSPRTSHRRRSAIARGRGDSANICS